MGFIRQTYKSKRNFLLILILFAINLQLTLTTLTFADLKNYACESGTQIYLFEDSQFFSMLSIDNSNSSQNTLKATLYLITSLSFPNIQSAGLYIGMGFGSQSMNGTLMVICGLNKNQSFFCKDYTGASRNANENSTQRVNIDNTAFVDLTTLSNSDYGSYKSMIQWSFTRTIASSETGALNVNSLISGSVNIMASYGPLVSNGVPDVHYQYYNNIKTGDGGNAKSSSDGSKCSKTTESTGTGTGSTSAQTQTSTGSNSSTNNTLTITQTQTTTTSSPTTTLLNHEKDEEHNESESESESETETKSIKQNITTVQTNQTNQTTTNLQNDQNYQSLLEKLFNKGNIIVTFNSALLIILTVSIYI